MPDFAQWLSSQRDSDPNVRDLKVFAAANPGIWPAASNMLMDYQTAVSTEPSQTRRDTLLTTLGQNYQRWFQGERQEGLQPGTIALFAAGLIIATALVYNMFFNATFFVLIGQVDNARGLITFLFSFGAIAIMVLVAVALFWMDVQELEARFAKAKDLLTILIGILGTIIGFYFGTATVSPTNLSTSAVTLSANAAAPGDKITISARAAGGTAPYSYDVIFTDPSGKIDTSNLNLKGKASGTGEISEQILVPTDVSKPATLSLKIVVRDSRGSIAESAPQTLSITPKSMGGQPNSDAGSPGSGVSPGAQPTTGIGTPPK